MSIEIKSPSVKDLLKRFETPENSSAKKDIISSIPKPKNDLENREASKAELPFGTSDPDIYLKRKQVIIELSNRKERNTNDRPFRSTSVSSSESKPENFTSSDNENEVSIEAAITSKSSQLFNLKTNILTEEEIKDAHVIGSTKPKCSDEEMVEVEMISSFLSQNNKNESTNTEEFFKHKKNSFQKLKHSIHLFLNHKAKNKLEHFIFLCSKIPVIVKFMVFEISSSNPAAIMSYLAIILSMISSFYPSAPHCNVTLMTVLWVYTSIRQQNKSLVSILSFAILISFVNDTIWLFSNSVVHSLQNLEKNDELVYELRQKESLNFQIAWYLLLLSILGKIGAWISMLRQEDMGRKIMKEMWKKIFVFFPPGSMRLPENVCTEVESRIIAIVWLEFVFTLSLTILTLYSHTRLFWAEQFSAAVVVASLINLLYIKIFCELVFLLSLLKNCSWIGVFSQSGCGKCFTMNSVDVNKVKISLEFFRFNWAAKALTMLPSCFLWISLESSFRMGGPNVPSQIRSTLSLITTCLSLLDLYCIILFIIATCYASSAKDQFPNWIVGEQSDDNYDFNNNIRSSQDLFEMRLSSADISSHNSSLKLDSNIEFDDDRFQEYWRTFQQQVQFNYKISRVPTIDECQSILASNLFYTIASGHIDANIYKVFFIGKSNIAICLAQMTVNPNQRFISIILKSNRKSMLRKFINNIPFDELFGNMRPHYVRSNE
jgi:hypothetical protein